MAGITRQPLIEPVETAMRRSKSRSGYRIYSFPEDLGAHSLVFNFSEYDYGQAKSGTVNKVTTGSISLPIPNNLSDSFNVRVAAGELGLLGNIAAESASTLEAKISGGGGGALDIINSMTGSLTGVGASLLLRNALEKADGGVIKGLEAATGYANNPHLALTFDGVDLKQHNFQWTLAPQSANESRILKNIIHEFKKAILPTYKPGFGRQFFNFPMVADLFFMGTLAPEDGKGNYLYSFKRCMVNTFEVNYAGNGSPTWVEGGKPAVVTMTMNLIEMDIHTAEDYGRTDGGDANSPVMTMTPQQQSGPF